MNNNNRTIRVFGTAMDKANRAKKRINVAKRYESDKTKDMVREDIMQLAELVNPGTEFVLKSNHRVVNNTQWEKTTVSGHISEITEQLLDVKKGFFNVISEKHQTGEKLQGITIDKLSDIKFANQKGSANETLVSFKDTMKYYKEKIANPSNPGKIIAWDLETYGAKDTNGIWRPEGITEFSMQETIFGSLDPKDRKKTTIMMGITQQEADKMFSEISTAIANGSIDQDERLRVTAQRMAKYGHKSFAKEKDSKYGFWKVANFPTEDIHDWKNLEQIKLGIQRHVEVYEDMVANLTDKNALTPDKLFLAKTINQANRDLKNQKAILSGSNDSYFDKPILESFLLKESQKNPAFKNIFDNGEVGLFVESNQWIDLLGYTKLVTNYNTAGDIYLGANIGDVGKIRGQENIVQKHLPNRFKEQNYQPHKAEDDVSALLDLLTVPSELGDGKQTYLDILTEKLSQIESENYNLTPDKSILRAKKSIMKDYGGRRYFNFAQSDSTNEIFTSDNHIITENGIKKVNYSAGFGVNKGQYYDLKNIDKISLTEDMRVKLGNIAPEFSGKEMYRVQLKMVADSGDYADMRINDLTQNLFFSNRKEMEGFLAGHFDLVAEHDLENKGEVNIVDGMQGFFDQREVVGKGDKVKYEIVNKDMSDTERYKAEIKRASEKTMTSRADNYINKEKSYKKISNLLDLEKDLQQALGTDNKITGKQISLLMSNQLSQKVVDGKIVLPLDNSQTLTITEEQAKKAKQIVNNRLGWFDYKIGKMSTPLRSTIDNNIIGMDMVLQHEDALKTIITNMQQISGYDKKSKEYKEELFERVYEAVKMRAADDLYNGIKDPAKALAEKNKNILNDKNLVTNLEQLKSMYELDYSKLIKGNRVIFDSVAQPDKFANVFRLDLSDDNSVYKLISTITKAIHGDKNGIEYEKDAMQKLFNNLSNDKYLGKTDAFQKIIERFKFKSGEFNEDFHPYEISELIIKGMQEVKEGNPTRGFINTNGVVMKTVKGSKAFAQKMNSKDTLSAIPDIVKDLSKNFQYTTLNSNTEIRELARNLVEEHYMPSRKAFEQSKHFAKDSKTLGILYDNTKKDLEDFMFSVIKAGTSVKGTTLDVQDNGSLLFSRGNQLIPLTNLPSVKLDDASGVMYIQLGSMKIQLGNELTFDKNGKQINAGTRSTLGILNNFDMSKSVKNSTEKDGAEEGLKTFEYLISKKVADLRQKSTINGFGGNDIDSNRSVDISNIKNVLVDMFSENGDLKHFVSNAKFMDKNIVETMTEDLKRFATNGEKLEDLSAEQIRNLGKNFTGLLESISKYGNSTEAFDSLIKTWGLTGTEKKVSSAIGVTGERPHNATLAIFDNIQRPPITQSGNAIALRVKNIKDGINNGIKIGAGNILTSEYMEDRLSKEVAGVGKMTSEVMMNIAYMGNDSLKILFEDNFAKVMADNNVEDNARKKMKKTYDSIKNVISTFEQERIMDSRVHEQVFGLQTASTQKLSKTFDIVNVLSDLNGKAYESQKKAVLNKGIIKAGANGEFEYSALPGRIVKRGEAAIKWKGFADLETSFASKMHRGVFNYNFYTDDGTKLKEDEINKIIKENKGMFNGLETSTQRMAKLEEVLGTYNIKGQFAIEDINAKGYAKTMTNAEKGETHILYSSTGAYNKKVKEYFKSVGQWEDVKSVVLTNEAIDAYYYADKNNAKKLKQAGFNSLTELKKAIREERHTHSRMLFDIMLEGKAHVIANDSIGKHGNVGQMYQGTFAKAIDSLSKKEGSEEKAIDKIIEIFNSDKKYQFINNVDISGDTFKKEKISLTRQDNRIFFGEMKTNIDHVAEIDSEKFKNIIRKIDSELEGMHESDRLIAKDVYVMNKDGQYVKQDEVFGSFVTVKRNIKGYASKDDYDKGKLSNIEDAKIIMSSNSRENLKYVRDPETQTGVDAQFFKLKSESLNLKKEKISLESQIANTNDNKEKAVLRTRLMKVKTALRETDDNLAAYSGAVKTMRIGDQELSILERVTITKDHVKQINKLIANEEINANMFLDSVAFQGVVKQNSDNSIEFSADILNKKALGGITSQIRDNQFYDSFAEEKLTREMVKSDEYKHLTKYLDTADKYGVSLGVDSAEKLYQYELADTARKFNENPLGVGKKSILDGYKKNGYTLMNIEDVNYDVSSLSTKNVLIDLGEEFNAHERYLAMPGLGSMVGDEEVKLNAQKKVIALQHRINDVRANAGGDQDQYRKLIAKAVDARQETIESLNLSLYGKNGIFHTASKLDVDMVSYRLKMSGIIGTGIADLSEEPTYLNKSIINGKTIAEWEKNGDAIFKYKYMSREQFAKSGYFDDDVLKDFGFLKEGVKKETAIEQMEDFLKTYGTYDITDRYPNIKTGSLAATRVFLAEDGDLANNQVKVSLAAMRDMNGDNDGDSISSFRIELKGKNNKRYDGAMYERAKMIAKENKVDAKDVREYVKNNNLMDMDAFDTFAEIERSMIVEATTHNKAVWNDDVKDIILKDYVKNQHISNPDDAVLLPGGKSILGKRAFAAISSPPSMQDFDTIENNADSVLKKANEIINSKDLKIDQLPTSIREGNSSELLDNALNIIEQHGDLTKNELERFQIAAIKRVNVDKYATEVMAKTGLAATGSVNVAMNAIKLAAHFKEETGENVAFTNYVWAALDVAEQGVISSKKINGKTTYDDKRIKEFRKAMNDIFKNPNSNIKNSDRDKAIDGLLTWLDEYGEGIFTHAYKNMGDQILSEEQLQKLNNFTGDEKIAEGAKMMREAFAQHINDISKDKVVQSYAYSFNVMGRNGKNVPSQWDNGMIGIAAAEGNSSTGRFQGMINYSDEKALEMEYNRIRQASERFAEVEQAKKAIRNNADNASANAQEIKTVTKAAAKVSEFATEVSHVGGLGKVAVGLAAGLLVGGYASGNPLNDKSAQQHNEDMQQQPTQTMSIPQFMEQEGGYITGNSQQGYIINLTADTKKGRKYMERMMKQAAQATVGGAVNINMNIKNKQDNNGISDKDIENFINKYI